jgi:hypothetical protein
MQSASNSQFITQLTAYHVNLTTKTNVWHILYKVH